MAELLPMRRSIDLMREAFRLLSNGEAVCPARLRLPVAGAGADCLIMPCHLPGSGYFGIKTINMFPGNPQRGLPVINSIYHLYSAETGLLLATMDGTMLTKLRTGAASGLASELLAAHDSAVLALFGTGAQAESQVQGVCCVRPIREIIVFGLTRAMGEEFARRMSPQCDAVVRAADGPRDLRRADIICTATHAAEPLFDASDVKPGAHVNAIGAYRPDMCEIPAALIASCRLIVDQTEAALEEAGDIIQPLRAGLIHRGHILAELGNLLDGAPDIRRDPAEITVFKSVGSAVQDFVCAMHLLSLGHRPEFYSSIR